MKLVAKLFVLLALVMTVQIFGQPTLRLAQAEEEMTEEPGNTEMPTNGEGSTNTEEPASGTEGTY